MMFCRKNLTSLQRKSVGQFGAVAGLTVATNLLSQVGRHHVAGGGSGVVVAGLSAASVAPVVLAAWVVGRYLRDEPDEFVRWLVVRALLWATAVTLAGDAVLGAVMTAFAHPFPVGLLNADLFIASTGIAFRLLLRGYR